MKSLKGKILIASGALLLVFVAMIVLAPHPPDPLYNGKHESEWFEDFCSPENNRYISRPREEYIAAVVAFKQAGPEFVPYLTNQLRYDRSGIIERPLAALQNFGLTSKYFSQTVLPSHRRWEAAWALERMGTRAGTAVPALLEAWAKDKPDIKQSAIDALDAILPYIPSNGGVPLHPFDGLDRARTDETVLMEAVKRYPEAAVFFTNSPTNTK